MSGTDSCIKLNKWSSDKAQPFTKELVGFSVYSQMASDYLQSATKQEGFGDIRFLISLCAWQGAMGIWTTLLPKTV